MQRVVSLVTVLLLGTALNQTAVAQGASPQDLVKQAVAAEGGADALRGLKQVTIKGEARHWEPEQSFRAMGAGGEPRVAGDSTFTITWDLQKGTAREDWDRSMQIPGPVKKSFTTVVTPQMGYVKDPTGDKAMSGIRVATAQREMERSSPTLLLKALEHPNAIKALPDQKLGGKPYPAVAFTDGPTRFTILFDRSSHLPVAVRTRDDDYLLGDSTYDLILSDWGTVGGAKIARSLNYKLNNVDIAKIAYKDVTANAAAADAFAIPDAVKASAKAPAKGQVPYQWVIRRLNIALFNDSDAVNFEPGGGLKLVELSPNVQQVVGGSHNSLIVARSDSLVIFDAPINDWQSKWTINAAKTKYPGKPIKYLVLTHHHMDHTGGSRTYVAEGATVIVPAPDKKHFERIFRAAHTIVPDELRKHPHKATVMEVGDQMTLSDASEPIRLINIKNPHVDGMLLGYVEPEKIVWVTDIYSPGRDKQMNPGIASVEAALKNAGIQPARFAGGHGANGTAADFQQITAAK
jgi:glyoxylase-like metal-dependent hydrolase (beta-lactamase superfamily II)